MRPPGSLRLGLHYVILHYLFAWQMSLPRAVFSNYIFALITALFSRPHDNRP